MPLLHQTYSIIHSASTANTTAFTYSQVYAATNASPTINGVVVPMNAGNTLDVNINSISSTTGVFVLGEKANVAMGGLSTNGDATTIGGSYGG